MMRAAIYARVSSEKQRDKHTIDGQISVGQAFCASQGWPVVGLYVDDGLSAKTGRLDDRKDFHRMQRDAEARAMDVIVVVEIDRLARTEDLTERARILGPFQRLGIQIATPASGLLDMRTLLGELWVTLQAIFAADDNRKRAARVRTGQQRIAAEGGKPKGCTPFGLTWDPRAKAWGVDDTRATLVREACRRVAAGESCVTVARDFADRGAPAPRGRWTANVLWRIITSTHLTGSWVADRKRHLVVAVPRLIDDDLSSAVNDKLMARKMRGVSHTRHVYLLEGLAVCGLCRAPIFIVSGVKCGRHSRRAKYRCSSALRGRPGERCAATPVDVESLDVRVWNRIAGELASPGLAERLREYAAGQRETRRDWGADLAAYRKKLVTLDHKEAALLRMFGADEIGEGALKIATADIGNTRRMIKAQIATAQAAIAEAPKAADDDPEAWIASLRTLSSSGEPADRREIVRELVQPGAPLTADRIEMALRVETRCFALRSACSMQCETALNIRLVA